MLEGAGSLLGEPTQYLVVCVGEFHQRHAGGEAEQSFEGYKQQVTNEQEQTIHRDIDIGSVVVSLAFGAHHAHAYELETEMTEQGYHDDNNDRTEELAAFRKLAQTIDGHQTSHQLQHDKLEYGGYDNG